MVFFIQGSGFFKCGLSPQTVTTASSLKMYELLHRIKGEGLAVEYCFSRQPFGSDSHMIAVQLHFTNNTTSEVKALRVEEPKLQSGMRMKEFPEIGLLDLIFCNSSYCARDVVRARGDSGTGGREVV